MSSRGSAIDNIRGFRPIDIAILTYLSLEIVLISIFMRQWPVWLFFTGLYVSVAFLAVIMSQFYFEGRVWRLFRTIYPVIVMGMLYEALKPQVFMIHPLPFDPQVNSLEMSIFGFDTSFALQPLMTIWRNEIMSLAYMSYYFIMPGAVLFLAIHSRWEAMEKMVLAASIAFFFSYMIFVFYPVLGPRHYLGGIYYLPFDGPLLTPLVHEIVRRGGLYGGAMPSSHCAVALVAVYFLIREFRRAAFPLLTLLALLCLSTVYGRFHYVTDVAVGLALGAAALALARLWQKRFLALKGAPLQADEPTVEAVLEAGIDR